MSLFFILSNRESLFLSFISSWVVFICPRSASAIALFLTFPFLGGKSTPQACVLPVDELHTHAMAPQTRPNRSQARKPARRNRPQSGTPIRSEDIRLTIRVATRETETMLVLRMRNPYAASNRRRHDCACAATAERQRPSLPGSRVVNPVQQRARHCPEQVSTTRRPAVAASLAQAPTILLPSMLLATARPDPVVPQDRTQQAEAISTYQAQLRGQLARMH